MVMNSSTLTLMGMLAIFIMLFTEIVTYFEYSKLLRKLLLFMIHSNIENRYEYKLARDWRNGTN